MAASQSLYAVYVNTQGSVMRLRSCSSLRVCSRLVGIAHAGRRSSRLSQDALTAADHTIWLRSAAPQWDHAFPVGNGRLGAMVFGTVNRERIQLNEETLWMGGPRETDNPEARAALPEVRRLLFAGQPARGVRAGRTQADGEAVAARVVPEPRRPAAHLRSRRRDHRLPPRARPRCGGRARHLSRRRRAATRARSSPAIPTSVIVVRLTVDRPGALTFGAWIDRQQDARTEIAGTRSAEPDRQLAGGKGLSFLASAKVIADGGSQETFPERILVERRQCGDDHREPPAPASRATIRPASRSQRDLAARRREDRTRSCVGDTSPIISGCIAAWRCVSGRRADQRLAALPTDERLERVKRGASDPALDALYFQFGRYLLIASSRPGDLPANLQGLWNDSMSPPWDADYHLNINLQMNYWPAEVTNLAELHEPLFDFLESLREPGRKTARVHYGARGFVAHHITDIWGFTSPGDLPRSGLWPTGAAWLTQHLWEHYLFAPDRAFLGARLSGR